MIEHCIPYEPENSSIIRYDYKYLRLQGMAFCEANWNQGEKLPELLLSFLARKADEYGIESVDIPDCMGAIHFQYSLGVDSFQAALKRYREPFIAEKKEA
tara:strand:+ start:2501 stop:2800 length:300 start_codon:yes stop_codon:yes gene_type:complete